MFLSRLSPTLVPNKPPAEHEMDAHSCQGSLDHEPAEYLRHATHRGIIERLSDPYLTDHDRWVLGQFARFLEGQTPGPDPRVEVARAARPLYSRSQRSSL